MLKLSVQSLNEIWNSNDLKWVVRDIWSALSLHYIWSLYASLSGWIRYVLQARGNIIKYWRIKVGNA
jgi:hypothetical protein